jgi:intracellular sulfur oxidation DsrE/DsrF family protein
MTEKFSHPLRRIFISLFLFLFASVGNVALASQTTGKPQDNVVKVVYHADFSDPRRFSAMLSNIHNMVSTYQSELVDYDIRIVFVSWGIRFVTGDKLAGTPFAEDEALKQRRSDLQTRLATLRDLQGVKLEVCGITREQIGLDEKKLMPGVKIVHSGVVQIVELQRQGFAYLKVE